MGGWQRCESAGPGGNNVDGWLTWRSVGASRAPILALIARPHRSRCFSIALLVAHSEQAVVQMRSTWGAQS